jgi:hypothetical protein
MSRLSFFDTSGVKFSTTIPGLGSKDFYFWIGFKIVLVVMLKGFFYWIGFKIVLVDRTKDCRIYAEIILYCAILDLPQSPPTLHAQCCIW